MWMGAGVAVIGGYAGLVEPNRLTVKRVEIKIGHLPETFNGTKIAQISDIHFGEFLGADHVRDVVREVNALEPDVVVFTGDLATFPGTNDPRQRKQAAVKAIPAGPIMAELKTRLGRFAVLGNHDVKTDPVMLAEAITQSGMTVVRNKSVPVERDGQRIWIAGIDDYYAGVDIPGTLSGISKGEVVVTLVHEPDLADAVAKYPVDLQLSGHSHGGQVRIPFIGAPILPPMAEKYPLGFYRIGNLQLYTNPGVGVVGLPIRFDCPPEITLVTLTRG
jgi:predicted MPP superfamily phosphohydrolase